MNNIHEAARAAIHIQSACNLSGVAHSFSEAVKILRAQPDCTGTDWVNRHPISVLYATQIASLTRVAVIADDACDYGKAYAECERLAQEVDRQQEEINVLVDKGLLLSV